MRFYISKIYLWFSATEKRCIELQNNKINVIRGNSSRGKSNIFAIIDYCLMSDKPNIVEPIINECTEFYGMEFRVGDSFYAISRKRPDTGTASSCVWVQKEAFDEEYYPSGISNIRPNDLRRELDYKFGLTEEYIYPWGKKNHQPLLTVSFRSFLMFNALTENLITSQYEFLNYKFFEDEYVDSREKRTYLMDVVLGIDNVLERKQRDIIKTLDSAAKSNKIQHTKYKNARDQFYQYLSSALKIYDGINKEEAIALRQMQEDEVVAALEKRVEERMPRNKIELTIADKKRKDYKKELFRKQILLSNIRKAKAEYEQYIEEQQTLSEDIRPIEYLRNRMSQLGATIWAKQILEELQNSLSRIKIQEKRFAINAPMLSERNIENLEREITELELKIQSLSEVKLKPIEDSDLYFKVGQLKSMLPILYDYLSSIPKQKPEDYDYVEDSQKRNRASEIINTIEIRRGSVVGGLLNPCIQEVYEELREMDNFSKCKTRYERNKERLELSDGNSILNYTNIGSQSNYMFMHICFFLGLHRFLYKNPCQQIGQFLFIDQPSVPYYENKDDAKSNDKNKLLDAFRVINNFMKEMVEKNKEQFQIILIEHADNTYWTGDNNLEYFETRANFDGNEALVPYHVVNKKRNENKN